MGVAYADDAEKGLQEGRAAAERLGDVLQEIGLPLPRLQGSFPYRGEGTVDLGSAPAKLVDRIAAWIEERTR